MKKTINHILVPTDFSAFSNRAFRFANKLAEKESAEITLFHVVEPPYNFATAVKGMIEMMEKNALSRMDQLISESGADIHINTEIRHGRTTLEILQCIERDEVDLVVMGSRGQSKLSRAVLGSVSETIAHQVPVPLFLFPETPDESDISTFIFATDFRKEDPAHLQYTTEIASHFNASVSPVHIAENFDFDDRIRHLGFTEVLRDEMKDESILVEIENSHSLLHGIADFVSQKKNPALVFNRYKKSILQRLFKKDHTDEMVVYADIPLLIIPSGTPTGSEE